MNFDGNQEVACDITQADPDRSFTYLKSQFEKYQKHDLATPSNYGALAMETWCNSSLAEQYFKFEESQFEKRKDEQVKYHYETRDLSEQSENEYQQPQ